MSYRDPFKDLESIQTVTRDPLADLKKLDKKPELRGKLPRSKPMTYAETPKKPSVQEFLAGQATYKGMPVAELRGQPTKIDYDKMQTEAKSQLDKFINSAVGEQKPYEKENRPPGFDSNLRSLGSNLVTGLQRFPIEMAGSAIIDPLETAKGAVDFPVDLLNKAQVLASQNIPGEATYQGMPMSEMLGKKYGGSEEQKTTAVTQAKKELFERPEAIALAAMPLFKGLRAKLGVRSSEISPKPEIKPTEIAIKPKAQDVGYEAYKSKAEHRGAKEPWEMTKQEFNDNYSFHGSPKPIKGEIKEGSWFSDYDYAKSWGFGKAIDKTQNRVYAVPKGELKPTKADKLDISGQEEIKTGASIRSANKHKGVELPFDGHKGLIRQALSEGKPVPKEVLADYPELAKSPAVEKAVSPDRVNSATTKVLKESMSMENILNKKAVGRQDIAEYFNKSFDVPIRFGKIAPQSKAIGFFNRRTGVIRSKTVNDLSTISHEVGHYLENKVYGGFGGKSGLRISEKATNELLKLGKDLYGDRKPNGGYRSEGFAEFMAAWLTTDKYAELAPNFTKYFEEKFLKNNPEIAQKLTSGRELVTKWRQQGAVDRIYANIDFNRSTKFKDLKEKATDLALRIRTLLADDLAPLEYAEKKIRGVDNLDPKRIDPKTSPTMIARSVALTSGSKAREMALHGTFNIAGEKTGVGLREILEPFKTEKELKDFTVYSYANRAVELHGRGIDPGISLADAKYAVEKLKTPEIEKANKAVTAFEGRVIDYLVESGGMSKEAAEAIMTLNAAHIPLKRVVENRFAPTGGKKLSDTNSPIKRIKGSGRPIIDPIESIIENTATIIAIADKVRVGRVLIELSEKFPNSGKYIEKIPTPLQANRIDLNAIKKQLEDAGVDLSEANMEQVITTYSNAGVYKGKDNIVSFVRDGKREFYEVDKRLYGTLKALDNVTLPPFMKFLSYPARSVRLGATGLNVGFGLITNPLRDIWTYSLQTEFSNPLRRFFSSIPKKFRPSNEINTLFRRTGTDMSQFLGLDRKQLRKAIDEVNASTKLQKSLNVMSHPIEVMKDLFSITEAMPRLAEFEAGYKSQKKLGRSSESASIAGNLAASDVTINFKRAGAYGRYLNQIIPFFNAAVQGTTKFYRFSREHPLKAMAKGVSHLTIPTLGIWYLNKDEDWYRDLEPWQRYGFWNIHVGKNEDGTEKILRLPKPFEWGNVYSVAPEMVADYMYSKDPKFIKEGLGDYFFDGYIFETTSPDFLPVSIKIPIEQWANYDFFRDRPIDPYFEVKYKDPADRFSPYSSETAKFIGKTFNLSPRKIDHLISSSTGGLGRDIINAGEVATGLKETKETTNAANYPVVGRLFQRTRTEEEKNQSKSYMLQDEKQKIKNGEKSGRYTKEEAKKLLEELKNKYEK